MRTYHQGGFTRVKTGRMDTLIPKNTTENTVSGRSGRMMMVELAGKAMKTGFFGGVGV